MNKSRERREHDRYPIKIPAKLKVTQKDGQSVTANFRTENISAGGALIHADQALEMGAKVEVHLVLPLEKLKALDSPTVDVNLSGRVIRLAGTDSVIEFDQSFEVSRGKPSGRQADSKAFELLTNREKQILDLISAGASNREIADTLSIGLATVKSHVYSLYKKIKVKNRFQAILWRSHNS